MKLKNVIKTFLIGFCISCGSGNSEEGQQSPPNDGLNPQQINELVTVLSNSQSMYEIKFYCEKTGGSFSQSEPFCSCPPNMQFVGQGAPGCYDFTEIQLPLHGQNRVLSKSKSKDAYPMDFSEYNERVIEKKNLSVLWKPFIHVPKEIEHQNLTVGDLKKVLGFYGLSDEPDSLSTFSDVLNPNIIDPNMIGMKENMPAQIKKHIARDFVLNDQELLALEKLPWKQMNMHPRKCLVHCEFRREYSNSTVTLEWIKKIRGGQHFREYMVIRQKGAYFHEYFIPIFRHLGRVRIDSVIKMNQKFRLGKIINEVTVFNRARARVFEWDLLTNISHKEIVKQEAYEEIFENSNSKILLCDSDVQIEQLNQEKLEKLALFDSSSSESFYGLLNSQPKTVDSFLEVINANRNGVLHTSGLGHATDLIEFADEASVIPFSIFPCLGLVDQWSTNASVKGVKVVNLSAADEVHNMNACRRKDYTEKIRRHGLSFLWVMAADNVGKEVTGNKSTSCPQKALYEDRNVVIVSHSKMEFGSTFVDLIIDRHYNGGSSSASESTMIISQIANDLFNEFPKASPAMMKKALILGADLDEWKSHRSRAGGDINLKRTRKILADLIRRPGMSHEKIIKKHFGYFDDEKKKLAHIQEFFPF